MMSTVFGVFSKNRKPIPEIWGNEMAKLSSLWLSDVKGVFSNETIYLGCHKLFNTPESTLVEQPFSLDGDCFLLFDGRLDNRLELASLFNITSSKNLSDEELILKAYQCYGHELSKHLIGDFVIVIYDLINHALLLIRDHLGVKPLFIAENSEYLAFSSNKRSLLGLGFVDHNINEQWVADLLAQIKVCKQSTFYEGISSFLPAHYMLVSKGLNKIEKYWSLDETKCAEPLSDQEYIERFKELFDQAIACRLRVYGEPASELSGGLDSTSIVARASSIAKESGIKLNTFSHQLAPEFHGKSFPFKDESKFIEAFLIKYPNIQHTPVYSKKRGVLQDIKRAVNVHSAPLRNDLTFYGDEMFSTMQEQNIRVLLSGFGGDHLVTSHGDGFYSELVNSFKLSTLYQEAKALNSSLLKQVKFLTSVIFRSFISHINEKILYRNKWSSHFQRLGAKQSFLKKHGYPNRFYLYPYKLFKGSVKQREFHSVNSAVLLYRLEDSALGAASYGVEYRYPMLDIRLMEFCLSLPSTQKLRNGIKRRMIREAMKNILPEPIRLQNNKCGATVPSARQRYLQDKASILTLLDKIKYNERVNKILDVNSINSALINMDERTYTSDLKISHKSSLRALSLIHILGILEKVKKND